MNEELSQPFPKNYDAIKVATATSGFTMASDVLTCSLLRTLATCKPASTFLEFGTGTGLSTSWILDGMDSASTIVSIDNDAELLKIATANLGQDKRLNLICIDGANWIEENAGEKFDYIFADTWHGKYLLLQEVLLMLKKGALYIIDDMMPQANWPDGHAQKANDLVTYLESRSDLVVTKQLWATGIIIAAKK